MRTEPHRSITKARVDYRYGASSVIPDLEAQHRDISLRIQAMPLLDVLRRTLPYCDEVTAAYYLHNLQDQTHEGTQAWAATWTEDGAPRVETSIAICPEDDQSYRDNTRFQCAQELLEQFCGLLREAMRIRASQPVEGEFVAVD